MGAIAQPAFRGEAFSASQVRSLILDEIADWGSQKAVAGRIGVSPQFLCDVLNQRREPGPKIAAYFELEPLTIYVSTLSTGSRDAG